MRDDNRHEAPMGDNREPAGRKSLHGNENQRIFAPDSERRPRRPTGTPLVLKQNTAGFGTKLQEFGKATVACI